MTPKREIQGLPSFLAETRKAALAEIRNHQRAEFEKFSISWPRRSPKKGDFDYNPIYREIKKYVKSDEIPKLKDPNRAGKKTKNKLIKFVTEIAKRKNAGMVYYPIRGKKNAEKFNKLFNVSGPEFLKGGWIIGTKADGGRAKLKFDKKGNPKFQFKKKGAKHGVETDYIEIDGNKFLKAPVRYIKSLRLRKDYIWFPTFGRPDSFAVGNTGAGTETLPNLVDLLLNMESDSDSAISKGRLTGLTHSHAI